MFCDAILSFIVCYPYTCLYIFFLCVRTPFILFHGFIYFRTAVEGIDFGYRQLIFLTPGQKQITRKTHLLTAGRQTDGHAPHTIARSHTPSTLPYPTLSTGSSAGRARDSKPPRDGLQYSRLFLRLTHRRGRPFIKIRISACLLYREEISGGRERERKRERRKESSRGEERECSGYEAKKGSRKRRGRQIPQAEKYRQIHR